MGHAATPQRSRVPWALAVTVGLCSGLAGYVIHAARVNRIPKQVVTVKRLTDMPGSEETPAISPDGTKVAFVAAVGDKRQIWVGQAITKDDTDHFGPRWAADSKSLIYFANNAIWEIPAAGGEARKLVDALGPGDLNQEGKLAFLRRADGGVELMADAARCRHADRRQLFESTMVAGRQEDRVLAGHEGNGRQRFRRGARSSIGS